MEFAREQVRQKLFSINRICILTGISKNTYYDFKHPDERFSDKYQHIKNNVKKIIKDNCSYGVTRIKGALKEDFDVTIGRDALGRLLKLWGLDLKRKIKKSKISMIRKILISLAGRSNLLIRTIISAPFQTITGDITEILYDHGKKKAYLSVHKDVFGQVVYGWCLMKTMEFKIVKESFLMMIKTVKKLNGKIPNEMLCHQDRGSQYTSHEYVDMALKNNLKLSYSSPGTPTDNPGQESFFGRLKDENRSDFLEFDNFEDLKKFVKKRINYYNGRRLHTSINCQSPLKFTINFLKKLSLSTGK